MNIKLKKVKISNGETLGYRERMGGKEVLLIIHGNMTSSKHWDIFMENFDKKYKLIAPDMRGFGISTYNNKITSISDLAQDLKLFVEKLNLNNFFLMGWSTGGCVAMKYTADNSEKVKKLILLESISTRGNPLYKLDENGNIMPDQRIKTKEEIRNDKFKIQPLLNAYENKNKEFMKAVWNNLIYTDNQPDKEKYDEYIEDMFTQRNLVEVYHAINHFNISNKHDGLRQGTNEAAKINLPTLVLWGDNDKVVPKKMAEAIVNDIGENAKLKILKGCGHSPLIDDLQQLIQTIKEFLKK
ncbi:MAG: alpha/beta hydrolase [Halanaerobiales bacterium]|nr:alpha/beta hydrolase [Halanaerobiales bacterium]